MLHDPIEAYSYLHWRCGQGYFVQPHIWCLSLFKNTPKHSLSKCVWRTCSDGLDTIFKRLSSISRQALALAFGNGLRQVNSIPEMSPSPHAHGLSAIAVQGLTFILLVSSPDQQLVTSIQATGHCLRVCSQALCLDLLATMASWVLTLDLHRSSQKHMMTF